MLQGPWRCLSKRREAQHYPKREPASVGRRHPAQKKEAIRVLRSLAENPLKQDTKLVTPVEKSVAELGVKIRSNKFNLIIYTLDEQNKQLQAKQKEEQDGKSKKKTKKVKETKNGTKKKRKVSKKTLG